MVWRWTVLIVGRGYSLLDTAVATVQRILPCIVCCYALDVEVAISHQ